MKNKRGWIKVVEAFISLLLITGVVLVLINKGYFGQKDISTKVYEVQTSILKEIEKDDSLRGSILSTNQEAESSIIQTGVTTYSNQVPEFPNDVELKLIQRITKYDYISCQAKICELDKNCALLTYPSEAKGKSIYAQNVAISVYSGTITPDPKQLKLFC